MIQRKIDSMVMCMDHTENMFVCNHCGREFKRKGSHERHVGFCEFEMSCDMEGDLDSSHPPVDVMFGYMKEMMHRIQALEKDNKKLRQHMYRSARKIDVVKWLNINIENPAHLLDWLDCIEYSNYLDCVFTKGLHNTIQTIIDDNISLCPIKTVATKSTTFYVYEDKWVSYSQAKMKKVFETLADGLLLAFQREYTVPDNACEEVMNKYAAQYSCVLGENKKDAPIYPTLCSKLHEKCRVEV